MRSGRILLVSVIVALAGACSSGGGDATVSASGAPDGAEEIPAASTTTTTAAETTTTTVAPATVTSSAPPSTAAPAPATTTTQPAPASTTTTFPAGAVRLTIVNEHPTLPEWRTDARLSQYWDHATFSYPEFVDFRKLQKSYEAVAAYGTGQQPVNLALVNDFGK